MSVYLKRLIYLDEGTRNGQRGEERKKMRKGKEKLEGLDKEREVCIFIFLAYEDERILNNFMCGRRYSK